MEHDRQSLAGPTQRLPMKHEDSSELGHLAATHAPFKLFPGEDYALLRRYVKKFPRNSPIRFVHAFYIRRHI